MCTTNEHLSESDKRFLKALWIQPWPCPECERELYQAYLTKLLDQPDIEFGDTKDSQ